MKPFALKRFVLLPLIIVSLILTTGCHLLSHYSEEEVQQYIDKDLLDLHELLCEVDKENAPLLSVLEAWKARHKTLYVSKIFSDSNNYFVFTHTLIK